MKGHEDYRKELWKDTLIAVAGADNCVKMRVAVDWADEALEEFDKRFPKDTKEEE
jgi:hypothetical protein